MVDSKDCPAFLAGNWDGSSDLERERCSKIAETRSKNHETDRDDELVDPG